MILTQRTALMKHACTQIPNGRWAKNLPIDTKQLSLSYMGILVKNDWQAYNFHEGEMFMKKFLALLLAAIMCFALAGCGESGNSSSNVSSKAVTSSKIVSSSTSGSTTTTSIPENTNAKLDTNMIKSVQAAFSSDFSSVQLEDKTLSSNKKSLFVEITDSIKDGTADKFISCASNTLKMNSLESSKYDSISFTLNNTGAILVVNKKNAGLSSNLTCLRLSDSEKKGFELAYQKDSYFSEIDTLKSAQRDLDKTEEQFDSKK